MTSIAKRYALFSCTNKFGTSELARFFQDRKYDILSTNSTFTHLHKSGIVNNDYLYRIRDITDFPEILDGRVKTLHPRIFGGLLGVRNNTRHYTQMSEHKIPRIDVLVTNLYEFEKSKIIDNIDIGGVALMRAAAKNYESVTVISDPSQYKDVMNRFDNFTERDRLGLSMNAFGKTAEYDRQIYEWTKSRYYSDRGCTSRKQSSSIQKRHYSVLRSLGLDIERMTDTLSDYLLDDGTIENRKYKKSFSLKYGSNPHQNMEGGSGVYAINGNKQPFKVVNGIPSYINMLDGINSWQLVVDLSNRFGTQAAASFKHTSPAGAAVVLYSDLEKYKKYKDEPYLIAYKKAREGDPMSSFGDFIAIDGKVTKELAKFIMPLVSDGIIANSYSDEALDLLSKKKKGKYVMIEADKQFDPKEDVEFKEMYGIVLSQPVNKEAIQWSDLQDKNIVSARKQITKVERNNLMVANLSLKFSQSNNVSIAHEGQLIGISAGQQSRIHSTRLATDKATVWLFRNDSCISDTFSTMMIDIPYQDSVNLQIRFIEDYLGHHKIGVKELKYLETRYNITKKDIVNLYDLFKQRVQDDDGSNPHGVCLASDAFIPFRDNVDYASKVHVSAIVQPGGSVKDNDVTQASDEYNMAMIHHGKRMFTH